VVPRARLVCALLALAAGAFAIDTTVMPSEELQRRYSELTHELRCMQCQNQSLADSSVDLAADLRTQVKEMLLAGKSNDEIRSYMVERYGNYILFTPPFEASTAWVWLAPLLGLIGGVIIAVRIVRGRARMVDGDDSGAGGEESSR
jgi:cytochrome c-type biogenesis protein CcmH